MGSSHSTPSKRLCEHILHVISNDKEYRCFKKSPFDFENLALEGGGAKGISYVGALKVSHCISCMV
jgi:predicted acylesterase/phospholipase RssA